MPGWENAVNSFRVDFECDIYSIGNNTSAISIGNTLAGEGLLKDGKQKTKPAVQTIQAYIKALTEAYFLF